MFQWPRSKRQNERQEKSSKLTPRQLSIKWRRGNELAIKIKIDKNARDVPGLNWCGASFLELRICG